MTIAETTQGIAVRRSAGGTGRLAMWQWTHSSGSEAMKGRLPVNISYNVTPRAYRSVRESIDRFIRPVCSGAMYDNVPAMNCGGASDWRSRGRRDAIPNPVSQTLSTSSTSTFAGLMSL
jgi:hypothetical protein